MASSTTPHPALATVRRGVLGEAIQLLERRPADWLETGLGPLIERLEAAFAPGEVEDELRRESPHLLGELRRLHWMRDAALVALRRLQRQPTGRPRRHALLALQALEHAERALVFRTFWIDTGGEG